MSTAHTEGEELGGMMLPSSSPSVWAVDTDCEVKGRYELEELRLAVQILGIHVTVYPSKGDYPFRYQIDVQVPQIVQGLVRAASSLP